MEKEKSMTIRISKEERAILKEKAIEFGFSNLSEYLRFLGLNCKGIGVAIEVKSK